MGYRPDLPAIKPDEQPSIINHEAGQWGYLAGLGASIAAIPFATFNILKTTIPAIGREASSAEIDKALLRSNKNIFLFIAGAELAGALLGGLSGKAQQQREQQSGRVVKDPGYWNKGILSGMLVSGLMSAPLALAEIPVSPWVTLPMGLALPIAGSIIRKNQLQRDYDKAVGLRQQEIGGLKERVHQMEAGLAPVGQSHLMPQQFMNSVTPEESAALAEKQQQPRHHATIAHLEKQPHSGHADRHAAHAGHSEQHASQASHAEAAIHGKAEAAETQRA